MGAERATDAPLFPKRLAGARLLPQQRHSSPWTTPRSAGQEAVRAVAPCAAGRSPRPPRAPQPRAAACPARRREHRARAGAPPRESSPASNHGIGPRTASIRGTTRSSCRAPGPRDGSRSRAGLAASGAPLALSFDPGLECDQVRLLLEGVAPPLPLACPDHLQQAEVATTFASHLQIADRTIRR